MSNVLINKFKTIDDSRARLKSILEDKGIQPSSTSLPGLVEDVNKLTGTVIEPEWTGVPYEEPPTDYYKPDIDFDAIYEADTDKDNFANVTLLLIKVADFNGNLGLGQITGFDNYKFSDTKTLDGYSHATYKRNLAHTWASSKDIDNGKGDKYRWIMCYSNIEGITADIVCNSLQLEAMIIYKGNYTGWGWRDSHSAPKYTELKEGVIIQAELRQAGSEYICPAPRTFISKAKNFSPQDGLFNNCINLEYYYDSSTYYSSAGYKSYNSVFSNCYKLKYIYMKQVYQLYEACFSNVNNCYIQIDEILHNLGRNNNYAGPFTRLTSSRIRIGTIGNNIEYMNNDRDDICQTWGNEIEIGTVYGSIRASAFNCDSNWGLWKHVKIDQVAGSIRSYAFQYCPLYGTIKLIASTLEPVIEEGAFVGSSLQKIDMSESSILSIANYAFKDCNKLTDISIGPKTVSIGDYVFAFCDKLKSIYIPDNVTALGQGVFWRSNLEHITLGEGITSLPAQFFNKLFNLKSVVLPNSLVTINTSAFRYCHSLEELIIPAKVDTIPTYCFAYSGLKKIIFENSSVKLNNYAFEGCYNLKEINIENISTFQEYIFNGCCLPEITLDKNITSYTTNSFNNCGAKIKFSPEFKVDKNINLNCCDINEESVLDLLYGLPTNTAVFTLDICPTIYNGTWEGGYTFWDYIKTKYVKETSTGLEWSTSSTEGAKTVANYVAAKNWSIT